MVREGTSELSMMSPTVDIDPRTKPWPLASALTMRLESAQDRPQRARDPATDAVTWAEGELKRVYES
jgi:hypothetical protein